MLRAYLGLGANLGDRETTIRWALEQLAAIPGVDVVAVSRLRETEPVGGPEDQPAYLNGVVALDTSLGAHALLGICKQIEWQSGRDPMASRNAPRPLDLDLLFYGDELIDTPDLVIPHPRLYQREFVLDPLRELGVVIEDKPRRELPEVVATVTELRQRCRSWVRGGRTIGLVPTMGALHDGHLSLVERARADCDRVVVTIFVNPLQFGVGEDLDRYPRTLAADVDLLREVGVEMVFVPRDGTVYREGFASHIAVGAEAAELEGAKRPAHFSGVATIVAKLWIAVAPDWAYFGQKDAQQVAVLRRLHQDLDLSGELCECPIVREVDGLAMSSRNSYLDAGDRAAAPVLHRALCAARDDHRAGERDLGRLRARALGVLGDEPRCSLEYLELRREPDLAALADSPVEVARILVAARFGETRLIDNMSIPG